MRCKGIGRRLLFLSLAWLLIVPSAEAMAADRMIRVRLLELHSPRVVSVTAVDARVDVYAGEFANPIFSLEDGVTAEIRVSNKQLHIQVEGREVFAQSLRLGPRGGGVISVRVAEGRSRTGPHSYSGELLVEADPDEVGALELVNVLGLEEYVAGVVAKEYPFEDEQGIKAMATAVRTYTLSALGRHGDGYDHVDHTLSQAYEGVERVTPAVRRAVRETEGEVITYDGELIQALYFSSSGGHTAGNEDVWGSAPLPYLRAQPDPYDAASPHTTWRSTMSRPDLLALLSDRFDFEVDALEDRLAVDGGVKVLDVQHGGLFVSAFGAGAGFCARPGVSGERAGQAKGSGRSSIQCLPSSIDISSARSISSIGVSPTTTRSRAS